MQRFEIAHSHSSIFDSGNLYLVQADGIRAMRRARTEDAFLRSGDVPPRVYHQNVAASAIEPRDDNDLIAGVETSEPFKHLRLEDQPGLGCAFVGLPGSRFDIRQLDTTLPITVTSKFIMFLSMRTGPLWSRQEVTDFTR